MLPAMFDSTTIPVLEQVVGFTQARHGMLAGNLANLDTPGYQVRDLSVKGFEQKLKAALAERAQSGTSLRGQSPARAPSDPFSKVSGELEDFLYHDQSTGNLESQVMAVAKNQSQYNLALTIMSSQFRLLQSAISERA